MGEDNAIGLTILIVVVVGTFGGMIILHQYHGGNERIEECEVVGNPVCLSHNLTLHHVSWSRYISGSDGIVECVNGYGEIFKFEIAC